MPEQLRRALARIPEGVAAMREALRNINDAPDFEEFLATLEAVTAQHIAEPDQGLATEFLTLRSALGQFEIDSFTDEDLTGRWMQLRGARGNLYADIDDVLRASAKLGILPQSSSLGLAHLSAAGAQGTTGDLDALVGRMRALEATLVERVAPEGMSGPERGGAQVALVQQYLATMRRSISLFYVTLNISRLANLVSLERLVSRMAQVTRGFNEIVTSVASRATAALRQAAALVRRPLARLALGLGTLARIAIRDHATVASADQLAFDLEAAKAMILAGEAPPPSWRDSITELNFAESALSDLRPLADLTALESLNLIGTAVSDVTPLSGLTKLRALRLSGTEVQDVAPLAGAVSLETLYLVVTPVRDLAPLAGLAALADIIVESSERARELQGTFPRPGVIRVSFKLRRAGRA